MHSLASPTSSLPSSGPDSLAGLDFPSALLRIARLRAEPAATLAQTLAPLTEIASAALAVARVGVWLYDAGRTAITCVDLCVQATEPATSQHASGTVLAAADYPRYFAALESARVLLIDDAVRHADSAEFTDSYLRPLGIGAILDAPIFRDGQVAGVVCHEHVGAPRAWTLDESRFAASVADLAALLIDQWERHLLEAERQRQVEEQQRAQKMMALGRLAGGIAHDFNNILTAMFGHAQIIAALAGHDGPLAEQAAKLIRVGEQATRLTSQLLLLSAQREPSAEALGLDAVLRGLDQLLESLLRPRCHLECRLDAATAAVLMDATQLVQVVANLAVNARDAMPDGGLVQLRTGLLRTSQITALLPVGNLPAGHWATLSITDHGLGMDEAVQRRLFEPFFTTKPTGQGTGLGLATVDAVVQRAQGRIDVRSAPGQGSTFTIYLPVIAST